RLLVREGQGLPGLEGGQRRTQPHRTHHGVQDDVGVHPTGHELCGLRAGQHLDRTQATELLGELARSVLLGHGHDPGHERTDLAGSPSGAATAISSARARARPPEEMGSTLASAATDTRMTMSAATISPSHVLEGLMVGARPRSPNQLPPRSDPNRYAAMSNPT